MSLAILASLESEKDGAEPISNAAIDKNTPQILAFITSCFAANGRLILKLRSFGCPDSFNSPPGKPMAIRQQTEHGIPALKHGGRHDSSRCGSLAKLLPNRRGPKDAPALGSRYDRPELFSQNTHFGSWGAHESQGLMALAGRDAFTFTFHCTIGKVDGFTTTTAAVGPIKFVGKDLLFLPAIRAFASDDLEIFKIRISRAMLGC
jgi:hypothetical protein